MSWDWCPDIWSSLALKIIIQWRWDIEEVSSRGIIDLTSQIPDCHIRHGQQSLTRPNQTDGQVTSRVLVNWFGSVSFPMHEKWGRRASHQCELNLSNRVFKCVERAFLVELFINYDCPQEFKHVVTEVVDFLVAYMQSASMTWLAPFPRRTNVKYIHYLAFDSKFVTVDEIERNHPRSSEFLRHKKTWEVLKAWKCISAFFRKAKTSTAYNQQATTNIIDTIRQGKLPDCSKREAVLNGKQIPGGNRTGFSPLPCDKLGNTIDGIVPLYEETNRFWRKYMYLQWLRCTVSR